MSEKYEGVYKYKPVVTTLSWQCEVQHRVYNQYYCNSYVWCPVGIVNIGGDTLYKVYGC